MSFEEWAAREYGVPVADLKILCVAGSEHTLYAHLQDCWDAAQAQGLKEGFASGKEEALHDIAQHIDKLIGELN